MDLNEASRGGGRSVEFLDQINMASIVMLHESGLIPALMAARIADGIAQLIASEREKGAQRSADYLDYEPKLIAGCLATAHGAKSPGHRRDHRADVLARWASQGI
jgi:argininosuccinate lyase